MEEDTPLVTSGSERSIKVLQEKIKWAAG